MEKIELTKEELKYLEMLGMERLRTLTACKNCGKGYPYGDLTNGLCKECVSKLNKE